MKITTFNSESRSCECVNRLGTHITVRNCSSSSTRQSIAVKVSYSIISQLMWCIQFASLTIFTTPQLNPVSLMEVQISSWPTSSALRGLFAWKIPPWSDLCPATPVLVNRSVLCNCHLQTGLNYLLKSLSYCDSGAPFTMYFTVNSAFQHFMSEFGLSDSLSPNGKLLSQEYIFDIFLNDTSKPSIHPNTSWPILPLDPPNTLLELFQSISSRPHASPNSPFFPIVQHTSMKIPNYPRKGSFLFSTAAHLAYFSTACILTCMLAPQIYLACKHKKLHTLVTAMTLQRLPFTEAMSALEIPQNEEAKLICQDPWVSIAITLITILGIAVYVYRACSKMTFFKGYLYDNICTIYLFLSHECYHVAVKLRELNGLLHTFALSRQLKA